MDPALIGFGLGVGLLVGMTGIGGGSLMTPMLILVFGVTPITAIGSDLAYAAVTKTVGGYKHWRQRTVDVRLSSWIAIGSVPAAELLLNDIGSVRLRLDAPVFADPYERNRVTGSFILIDEDTGDTAGAGLVT